MHDLFMGHHKKGVDGVLYNSLLMSHFEFLGSKYFILFMPTLQKYSKYMLVTLDMLVSEDF